MTIQEKKQKFALEAESWLLQFADQLSDYYLGEDHYPDIEMAIELALFLERLNNPYLKEDPYQLTRQMEYYQEQLEPSKFPVTMLSGSDTPFLRPDYIPLPSGGFPLVEFLTKDKDGKPIWMAPAALVGQASELRIGNLRLRGIGEGADADWYKSVDGGTNWELFGGTADVTKFLDDTLAAFDKTYSSKKIVELLSGKVDAVTGKGLSSNDFTNELHKLLTRLKDEGAVNNVWTPEGYKAITDILTISQGPAFCQEYATYNALTLDNEPKPYSQLAAVIDATGDPNISDTATVKWALYFWDSYDGKYKLVIAGDVASNMKTQFSGIEGEPTDNVKLKAALDAKLGRSETELYTLAEKDKLSKVITTGDGTLVLCDDGLYRSTQTLGNGNPLNVDKEVKTYAELTALDTTNMPIGYKVFCWDASGDPNIVSGWAMYEWDGAAYVVLLKGDSLNVNLADYYTKTEINDLLLQKVSVVAGKSLVDDTEITKLASVAANAQPNRALATQAEAEGGTEATKGMTPATSYASIIKNAVKSLFTTGDVDMGGFWGATSMEVQAALQHLKTKIQEIQSASGQSVTEVSAQIKAEAESADFTNTDSTGVLHDGTSPIKTIKGSVRAIADAWNNRLQWLKDTFAAGLKAKIGLNIAPAYGLHQLGGSHKLQALANPAAPTISNVGTAGTTVYDYYVVAEDAAGFQTMASSVGSTATGNAVLDATNYNKVSWTEIAGAVKYYVLKGTTSALLGSTASLSFTDTGQTTAVFTPPTRNQTGDIYVDGEVYSGGSTSNGDNILEAVDVTVDSGANASPSLILRGKYDGDTTTAIVSTKRDFSLKNIVSANGSYQLDILDNALSTIITILSNGGIQWSGDTRIYRLAANSLRTDGKFEAGGNITSHGAFLGVSFQNRSSKVNSSLVLSDTGAQATTGLNANVGFTVNNASATATADLQQWQLAGIVKAFITAGGAGSFLNVTGDDVITRTGDGRGIKFWNNSGGYSIHMSAQGNATWGGRLDTVSDYNMYFRMASGVIRGFVFQNDTKSVAQIDGDGNLYLIGTVKNGAVTTESIKDASVTLAKVNPADTVGVSDVPATEKTKLKDPLNWDAAFVYTGPPIVNTYMGQKFSDATYRFEAEEDNVWIRTKRG